ncbi:MULTISPECIES: hypothetical protein [Streptomyces]|uniref:Uncharacterized protein n=2 Tax=Streptomyces TaxID=1883 RepID=A0ABV9JAB7_9ACTN
MLHVAADSGGNAFELALQPLFERRRPVVLEDADVGEYFHCALDAEPAGSQGREDLGVPHDFPADMAGQHDHQGSADVEADTARPAMRFAETMCGMPGPGQPRVVEPGMFLAIEPGEISAGLEQRRLEPAGDRPVGGGRG